MIEVCIHTDPEQESEVTPSRKKRKEMSPDTPRKRKRREQQCALIRNH